MSCTTILVGKKASYDGSTIIARNEDSGSGEFTPKKFIAVEPKDQPKTYTSVISKVRIPLPEKPQRYTAVPNANPKEGIWGEAGINEHNVAMTETETITSNPRVQGADPLVKKGIGEEDFLTIVLPYIKTAREGVLRLAELLEKYGTYEMNGVGFSDTEEIWWMETIGGHHWMAKRVPDEAYVVMPNQLGIDAFDFADAYGEKKSHLCSKDLVRFVQKYHLDLTQHEKGYDLKKEKYFDARAAFGSHDDSDHTYNTPRAWFMERYLNPNTYLWDGEDAEYGPESDDIPWVLVPEKKITIEDVKYVLSATFQGTPYDPYGKHETDIGRGKYRPIGINRNNFIHITQLRQDMPKELCGVQWLGFGSNKYNVVIPQYGWVKHTPEYLSNTTDTVTTENFYWSIRLIAALSDAHIALCNSHIERYQNAVFDAAHRLLHSSDEKAKKALKANKPAGEIFAMLEEANAAVAKMAREETEKTLGNVLYEASMEMKNGFSRSDA